jgi:hypothetical protein
MEVSSAIEKGIRRDVDNAHHHRRAREGEGELTAAENHVKQIRSSKLEIRNKSETRKTPYCVLRIP